MATLFVQRDVMERFWEKVDKGGPDGCWLWTGHVAARTGYGQINIDHRATNAHRFIFEHVNGAIPSRMLVDHICHRRSCVNPEHMRLVTRKQNSENMLGASAISQTGYRNVYPKPDGRFVVQVTHAGRRYSGGSHDTAEEADAAARELRNRLFTHNDVDRGTIADALRAAKS